MMPFPCVVAEYGWCHTQTVDHLGEKCRKWRVIWVGGLRFGHNGAWQGVLLAREPDVASGNPLRRIQTRYSERGRDCPRTH